MDSVSNTPEEPSEATGGAVGGSGDPFLSLPVLGEIIGLPTSGEPVPVVGERPKKPARPKKDATARKPRRQGRPPLLTEELANQIVLLVENGNLPRHAAGTFNIKPQVLSVWLIKGEEGKAPYKDFYDRIEAAKSKAIAVLTTQIRVAAEGTAKKPGDWKAAERLLKWLSPDEFADRVAIRGQVSHEHAHVHSGVIQVKDLTHEMIDERLAGIDARIDAILRGTTGDRSPAGGAPTVGEGEDGRQPQA